MRERTEPKVLEAVVNEVLSLTGARDAVLKQVHKLHATGGGVGAELKRLEKDEKRPVATV